MIWKGKKFNMVVTISAVCSFHLCANNKRQLTTEMWKTAAGSAWIGYELLLLNTTMNILFVVVQCFLIINAHIKDIIFLRFKHNITAIYISTVQSKMQWCDTRILMASTFNENVATHFTETANELLHCQRIIFHLLW